jgi:hypothetical protein
MPMVITLNVIMLSAIILNVVILSVVAPSSWPYHFIRDIKDNVKANVLASERRLLVENNIADRHLADKIYFVDNQ